MGFCCNFDLKCIKNLNKVFIFDEVDWIIFIIKINGYDKMVYYDLCLKECEILMYIVLVIIFFSLNG